MPRLWRAAAALSWVLVLLLLSSAPHTATTQQQQCNLGLQRALLLSTYNLTLATKGGWRYSQGWASAWAAGPRTWTQLSYTCRQPASTQPLPDHCCWPGVTCCSQAVCQPDAIDPTSCNCSFGAITGISLSNSNVTISSALVEPNPLACSLRSLSLHSTFLMGTVPDGTITGLSQLEYLDLSGNRLGLT